MNQVNATTSHLNIVARIIVYGSVSWASVDLGESRFFLRVRKEYIAITLNVHQHCNGMRSSQTYKGKEGNADVGYMFNDGWSVVEPCAQR